MKKISTVAAIITIAVALALFGILGSFAAVADAANEYTVVIDDNGNFAVSQGNTVVATTESFGGVLGAAPDGATLIFGKDGQTVNVGSRTLDFNNGNSYTLKGKISGSSFSAVVQLSAGGNLTLADAEVGNRLLGDAVHHNGTGTLRAEGATVLTTFLGRLIVNNGTGEVVVTGGTYTNTFRNIINVGAGTVTLNGGVFSNSGFTNAVYNAGAGTVNIGGTAALYSGAASRTVYNAANGTVNISGNAVLKHYSLGTIIDEEGVITGDLAKINNYSVYNAATEGKINLSGAPEIKGKLYILSPVNVSGDLSGLPTPAVIEYGGTVFSGLTLVTACEDSSRFRLDSNEFRLAASGPNLVAVRKSYAYYIYNELDYTAAGYDQAADRYILEADNCVLLKASSMNAVAKYIKDDSFDADTTIHIFFKAVSTTTNMPLRLKDGESFMIENHKTNVLGGSGIVNDDASAPLIVVNEEDAVVQIIDGTYRAKGIALHVAEGTAELSGYSVLETEAADDAVVKIEQGASVKVNTVTFAANANGEMSFMLVSDRLRGNNASTVEAILSYDGEDSEAAALLTYGMIQTSVTLTNAYNNKRYDFDPVDFIGLSSVTPVLKNDASSYQITYYLLDGSGTQTDVYYAGIGKADLLVPERAGYSFDGWYGYYIPLLEIYGNPYTSIPAGRTGNISLYAKWTFGAPIVTIPDLENFTLNKTYDGQSRSITPSVSHPDASASNIGYSYFWSKLEGNTYITISNRATLNVTNVADSGRYRLGVTATRNGNESKPTYVYVTVSIAKRTLTINPGGVSIANKVYDGTDTVDPDQLVYNYVFDNLVGPLPSYHVSANFDSKDAGQNKDVTIRVTMHNDNYTVEPLIVKADILPKALTVVGMGAVNKVYDGTTDIVLSGGVLQGIVGNDQVSFTGTASADAAAGTKPVTTALVLNGLDAGNYVLVQPAGISVTIVPKTIDVAWGTALFVYNGQNVAPTASVSESDLAPADAGNITITVSGAQRDVADYSYLAYASVNSGNYAISNPTASFDILPLTAVIEWGTLDFAYDGSIKKVTPVIANLCEGDTNVALIVANSYHSEVGTYTALITGINSLNYALPTEGLSAVYTIVTDTLPPVGGVSGSVYYSKGFTNGLSASLTKKESNDNAVLKAAIPNNMKARATYNLSLLREGAQVAPDGRLTVTFEVKNIRLLKSPSVLISENGVIVRKKLVINGNTATFTTASTGDFMLISEKSNLWIFAGMAIGGLGIVIFLIAAIRSVRYKVSFVTDGSKVETVKVRAGEVPYLLPSYKENHLFRGWYKDAALTKKFEAQKMPRKNLTLYAAFEPKQLEGFDLALMKAGEAAQTQQKQSE